MRILISAGEASGDLYAARVVETLRLRHPEAEFFGIAGPRMRAAGVRTIVDQSQLAVVGLVEVLPHIPRIVGILRRIAQSVAGSRPDLAILTDSAGFHLRLAKRLHGLGIPVIQLIAPQAWAWRPWRVRTMRRTLRHLLCILPFEEQFFRDRGVPATYIGHPLARLVRSELSRAELCQRLGVPESARIVAVLPGSRRGEVARHAPITAEAALRLRARHRVTPILALPSQFGAAQCDFLEPFRAAAIQVVEGLTWEVLAHAELALAASGTVTIEAAMLGTPLVTFYRVNALSWYLGRWLVRAPYLSMVNLVAQRPLVAELIQHEMTAEAIVRHAAELLENREARRQMQAGLAAVRAKLESPTDPMETAAACIERIWSETHHR
jgi:lipid-A-disaccharide synthase